MFNRNLKIYLTIPHLMECVHFIFLYKYLFIFGEACSVFFFFIQNFSIMLQREIMGLLNFFRIDCKLQMLWDCDRRDKFIRVLSDQKILKRKFSLQNQFKKFLYNYQVKIYGGLFLDGLSIIFKNKKLSVHGHESLGKTPLLEVSN